MIDLYVLLGKKGSVFKEVYELIKYFDLNINLENIIVYNEKFEPANKEQEDKLIKIDYKERKQYFNEVNEFIKKTDRPKIVFSWINKIIPKEFIDKNEFLFNQHPSLLPKYKGLNGWEKAINDNAVYTGTTIHVINEMVDSGKIILQNSFRIDYSNDLSKERQKLFVLQVFQAFLFFKALSDNNFDFSENIMIKSNFIDENKVFQNEEYSIKRIYNYFG